MVAQCRIFGEITEVAGHGSQVAGRGFFLSAQFGCRAHYRLVGLELREGTGKCLPSLLHTHVRHKVDCHVVGGVKGRAQWVGAGGCQPRQYRRLEAVVPHHHRMTFHIDAPPSRAPRQLGVLAGCEIGVGVAVELRQFLQHHTARWHVDAQSQGFGGKHGSDQAFLKEFLDHLFECRQHARVVSGNAAGEHVHPGVKTEQRQIGSRQVRTAGLGDDPNLFGFGR